MSHQEFFQELRKDHEELKSILQQMKSQSSQESGGLLMQLKMEITPHQEAEESTFYKALSEKPGSHKLALKGMEEHHVTDTVLKELEQAPIDDRWAAKVEVLEELVQEHIKEEESQVFDAARSIDANEIDNILRDFQSTKLQIKSDMSNQSAKSEPDNQSQAADTNPRSALLADEDLGRMV